MTLSARRNRAITFAISLVTAVAALTACSQVAGLGSSDLHVIYLSMASTDVLLDEDVQIQTKPVCSATDDKKQDYECAGSTTEGKPIDVTVNQWSDPDATMIIKIGGSEIYQGKLHEVLAENGESTS